MNDDIESMVNAMDAGEAVSNDEQVAPKVESESVEESASEDRNPDGTFKARDKAEPDESEEPEASAEDGDENDSDEDAQPERKERRRSARQRIGELTAKVYEARSRAEQAERQLAQLQKSYTPVDPNLEFEDSGEFTKQVIRTTNMEDRAEQSLAEREAAIALAQQATAEVFQARVEEFRDEMPDFDQVFNANVPITEVAAEFLAESDVGPKIAYHLSKNLGQAHRIAALNPVRQAVELTRLEAQLKAAPPAKRTTKAPKPAKPITAAGSSGTFDPSSASVGDIAKALGYGS